MYVILEPLDSLITLNFHFFLKILVFVLFCSKQCVLQLHTIKKKRKRHTEHGEYASTSTFLSFGYFHILFPPDCLAPSRKQYTYYTIHVLNMNYISVNKEEYNGKESRMFLYQKRCWRNDTKNQRRK